MIGKDELQALANLKRILYGLRSERFGIELCVELIAGRATVVPHGGRIGERTGRGGGKTRGRYGVQGNGGIDGQGVQVGGQSNEGDVRNVIMNNNRKDCTYNEFLACNPKEYDGKGGAIVYTHWIEKMESVQDMSGCEENQKLKYIAGLFFSKGLTWWNSLIRTRSQEVALEMSWKDFKTLTREEFFPGFMSWLEPITIQRAVQKAGTLIDEAVRNRSIKKNPKKKRNGREPNRDRNARDENKMTRTGNAFAITINPVKREYNSTIPKCVSRNLHHPREMPCRACFNCGRPGHMEKDCRVAPRMVNPVNVRNPTTAPRACYECGGTDHFKAACIDPSELGFNYEIEIAKEQLVYIDKVIRSCKLEIEGHTFDISLILFGSRSFNVIIGMDWLSNHKAEIVCHEKAASNHRVRVHKGSMTLGKILEGHGILLMPDSSSRVRIVIHHQVSASDVQYTLSCIKQAMTGVADENEGLNKIKGLKADVASVETNIVYFDILEGSHITAMTLGKILEGHGILLMPDSSSSAICALLDCAASSLSIVADAVAALSCEALKTGTSTAFNLFTDSGDGFSDKDRASVASDFKVLLNGSKMCGGNTQCSDLFFDIPRTHGRLRCLCKLIHSSTRVELNSIPLVLEGASKDLTGFFSSLDFALESLGEGRWQRGTICLDNLVTVRADFEVVKILTELLDELNISEYEIKLNHQKLLDGMLDICVVPSQKFRIKVVDNISR
nr:histidine--tRNA ligase, cytoplasmic [Tanacetum cinerariifolium]